MKHRNLTTIPCHRIFSRGSCFAGRSDLQRPRCTEESGSAWLVDAFVGACPPVASYRTSYCPIDPYIHIYACSPRVPFFFLIPSLIQTTTTVTSLHP